MSDEVISIRLKLREAARFAAETRAAKKEIDALGDAADRAGRKGKKAGRDMGIMGVALKTIAIAALALAQPIAASSLALVGFTAALAPAVGLLGALPAGIALGGQVFAVLALSLGGVTKAVGGLNKAMDPKKFAALSPHAQKLALVLDALKPRVKGLRESIQAGLFPGLTAGLIAAAPALDALKGPLGGTGKAIGGFATHLGQLVGSKGFLRDLSSQARFNNTQITRLGGAGLHLVNVFRNLMVGSRGLVSWLVQLIGKWSAHADALSTTSRASGGMVKGFHTVQVTLSRVGRLFGALGVSLFNIGKAGKTNIGDGILVYLLKSATALERWTKSDEGVNKLNGAFAWAHRELHMIAVAVNSIASSAGPGLGTGLRNLSNALTPLLTNTSGPGVLALYVQGLGDLAATAGWLERNVPGASSALSALFAILLIKKISGTAAILGGVTKAMRYLAVATKAATAAEAAQLGIFGAAKAVYAAFAASTLGVRIGLAALAIQEYATALAATIMWAAVAAPVAAVVIAVLAVGVALFVAYKKVGWFRHGVQAAFKWVKHAIVDVWDWIKTHWKSIGNVLITPFRPLVAIIKWVVKHFGAIKSVVGGIAGFVGKVGGFLGSINPFAAGGIVNTPFQLVGERGPELAALPMGSRVFTAPQTTRMLRAPSPSRVTRSAAITADTPDRPIHLHSTHVVEVSGKAIAKVVSDEVAKQAGR